MSEHSDAFEEFNRRRLYVYHAAEWAEAIFEKAGRTIELLVSSGMLQERIVLGKSFHDRDYTPSEGRTDSGRFTQAALHAPKGIGVVYWDTEEYHSLLADPAELHETAASRFRSYTECDAATKAILLLQLPILMHQLMAELLY